MSARVIRPAGTTPAASCRRARSEQVDRIRRQAAAAMRADLPVEWLAWLLWGVETYAPTGVSPVTGRAGALMAVTASWASGAYARPGRFFSASALDCHERTIERHWRIIEGLDLAVVTARGQWLSSSRRREVYDDPDEVDRWRDRQEWTLTTPAWAAQIVTDADQERLDRCRERAVELLRELTQVVEHRVRRADPPTRTGPTAPDAPKVPRGSLTRPRLARPVDNRPTSHPPSPFRVAPSAVGGSSSDSSGSRGVVLVRPKGRKRLLQTGATSSHSPTRSRSRGRSTGPDRRRHAQAAELARELLTRGHLPWLVRSPRYMLVSALAAYAATGWTAADVELAAQMGLDQRRFTTPQGGPDKPVRYLTWLLAQAGLDEPPAQARDAARERAQAERAAQVAADREAAAAELAAAEQARDGAGHQATRNAVATIDRRAGQRRDAERRAAALEQEQAAARARAGYPVIPPAAELDSDRLCAGGCGTLSAQVLIRAALPRPTPLCPDCWTQMRHLWT